MLGPTFILYWRSIFESARSAKVKNLWEIKWKLCTGTNIALLALKINSRSKEKNEDMSNDFHEIHVSEKDGRP